MNKFFVLSTVALIAVLALVGWSGAAPETKETRSITVTGDAELRVVPDEVVLTLGVETSNADLQKAKSENDTRVKQILALIQEHGVEAKHIQTEHVSIEPRYQDSYEKQGFVGFFVRKTIVVTLTEIEQFEELLTDVLESGATHVHGIQFRTTTLREHKDQARALAVNAAREKAAAMAQELGQKVGQPLTVHEEQSGWWSPYSSWWGGSWGRGMTQNVIQNVDGGALTMDGTLAPGQISVQARVAVSFELK